MDKKDITFADVSRSLNRLEGFIDDFLLTVQSYNEKRIIKKVNVIVDGHKETMVIYPIDIKKSIMGFIDVVKFNREGDEAINFHGIHDCVDYILNNQSVILANRAFSIETKIKEAEQIILPFLSEIKEANELLWETTLIINQIEELHVEPFIQDIEDNEQFIQRTNQAAGNPIPETGENKDANDEDVEHENNYPDFNYQLKRLFKTKENFMSFCDKSKDLSPENIASLYSDQSNVLNPQKKGVAKTLYDTFVNPSQDADKIVYETFLRYLRKSETE